DFKYVIAIPQEEFHECCYRSGARGDGVKPAVGVDGPHRFCRACLYRTNERPMEADVESLVRAGVGTNRLENAGSPVHRVAPTRRYSLVRHTPDVGSRRRHSYGLPGRRNRLIRSNRGPLSAARPTYNGDARLAGNLLARRASSSAAPDPQECEEVASDTSRRA